MNRADEIIKTLSLKKHPEGGYYKELYRSSESISAPHLPERFEGDRSFSTAIYFLLSSGEFSAFHRIKQDEIWHHYEGEALRIHCINPEGEYSELLLGKNLENDEGPLQVVPAGTIFAAELIPTEESSYSFVGCTVAPGFDFADFTLFERDELLGMHPEHSEIIKKLTH